jgi:hypothetical protein
VRDALQSNVLCFHSGFYLSMNFNNRPDSSPNTRTHFLGRQYHQQGGICFLLMCGSATTGRRAGGTAAGSAFVIVMHASAADSKSPSPCRNSAYFVRRQRVHCSTHVITRAAVCRFGKTPLMVKNKQEALEHL